MASTTDNSLPSFYNHTTNTTTNTTTIPSSEGEETDDLKVAEWIEHTTIQPREVDDKVSFWKLFTDNWLYVLTYCFVFGSFGVCVGFLGPTVFDLGCQTRSDQKNMNWVFFVQLIMTLVGSISAGCLAKRQPVEELKQGSDTFTSSDLWQNHITPHLSPTISEVFAPGGA